MSGKAFAKANTEKGLEGNKTKSHKICIGFYNLENLFDTEDDPLIRDDDFTTEGYKNWNPKRYEKKLKKLSRVIADIGKKETESAPSLLGVAEVENRGVLEDLINTKKLEKYPYEIAHFDSPDERGIDCGLLYRTDHFEVIESKPLSLFLESEPGVIDYTRDVLYVYGNLLGQPVHILVNHWPSRRKGEEETRPKRIAAAKRNRRAVDEILIKDPEAQIIVMGDFNDDPHSESMKTHLVQTDFYNPMVFLLTRHEGSLNHNFKWYLFDQIVLSNTMMKLHDNPLCYEHSGIFNELSLTEYKGRFKGNPFRTYAGKRYLGGYSDHFPVYCIFKFRPSLSN